MNSHNLFSHINSMYKENATLRRVGKEKHLYVNNNSNILGVAHLDTVVTKEKYFDYITLDDILVFSPQLDDRLGVHTLLNILPNYDINMDWLFTDNEEQGASTAADFITDKQYNWVVEFDRYGDTTVNYAFSDRTFNETLNKHFSRIGRGSFSDICSLEHLGCKAFNVAVGYHDEHTLRCYFSVETYFNQLRHFLAFYREFSDKFMPHKKYTPIYYRRPAQSSYLPTSGLRPSYYCYNCDMALTQDETFNCCCNICGLLVSTLFEPKAEEIQASLLLSNQELED